jgi:hypothetical protein
MEEKKPSDAGSLHEVSEQENQEDRMDSEFNNFGDLISSEENVEYEEDAALQTLHDGGRLKDWQEKYTERLDRATHPKEAGQTISIPLQIEMPEDVAGSYVLNISVSLQKAQHTAGPVSGNMGSNLNPDEEGEQEIDILDGRTTLIFDEEDEPEEEPVQNEERQQRGWLTKIFFWKKEA